MPTAPQDRPPTGPPAPPRAGRWRLPMSLADFERRGFRTDRPAARALLEGHARSFLDGFNLAVAHWRDPHPALAGIAEAERGFAYEGAAMFAGMRDPFCGGRALAALLDGPGMRYVHLVHVGYGWAGALPKVRLMPVRLPPAGLLSWLALDGAGFAETFFGGRAALRRRTRRAPAAGPDPRWSARVAGCGRALWFVESADVDGVTAEITAAPPTARPDLWAGIGLACAYAGGTDPAGLAALRRAAGEHREHFLQGVVFATTARSRAQVVPEHTRTAADVLLGARPSEVASWADAAEAGLGGRIDDTAYAQWRAAIRTRTARSAPHPVSEDRR